MAKSRVCMCYKELFSAPKLDPGYLVTSIREHALSTCNWPQRDNMYSAGYDK